MELIPLIERLVQTFQVIGFALFGVCMAWAAFQFMTAYGDPQKINSSRSSAFNACIGLGLMFAAPIIGNMVRRIASGG